MRFAMGSRVVQLHAPLIEAKMHVPEMPGVYALDGGALSCRRDELRFRACGATVSNSENWPGATLRSGETPDLGLERVLPLVPVNATSTQQEPNMAFSGLCEIPKALRPDVGSAIGSSASIQ